MVTLNQWKVLAVLLLVIVMVAAGLAMAVVTTFTDRENRRLRADIEELKKRLG